MPLTPDGYGYPVPATWPVQPGGAVFADDLNEELVQQLAFLARPPRYYAVANAAQSIPNNADTNVTLGSLIFASGMNFQPGGSASGGSGGGTPAGPVTPGIYLISGTVPWNTTDTTTGFKANLNINGNIIHGAGTTSHSNAGHIAAKVFDLYHVPASAEVGGVVSLSAFQNSGAAVSTLFSLTPPQQAAKMSMRWVGLTSAELGSNFTFGLVPVSRTWNANDLCTSIAPSDLTHGNFNTEIRDQIRFALQPPFCRATSTVVQSIPNNAFTALIGMGPTALMDPYNSFGNPTPNQWTCRMSGVYLFISTVSFAAPATGGPVGAGISATLSGTTKTYSTDTSVASASSNGRAGFVKMLRCNAGDTVRPLAFQNTGAAVSTQLGLDAIRFCSLWIAA